MGWIRRNKGATTIGVGIFAIVLALAIGASDDEPNATASPQPSLSAPLPDHVPEVYDGPTVEAPSPSTIGDRFADLGAASGSLGTALGPGLQGSGGTKNLPPRRIVLSMRSTAPIGVIGYVVPTSLDNDYGAIKDAGASWSIRTIGYGKPDYAQLFAQSGPTGARITCTITVDGVVTESRSTDGPYSQLFCQG